MTLTTEPGYRFSNSYCTVEEANTILATLPDDTTEWDALETEQQEFRLEMAAAFLGTLQYRGYKAYQYQALAFPRKGCQESLGWELTEIPYEVKRAQAYVAYAIVHRALESRVGVTEDSGSLNVKSFSVGGLSISFGDGPAGVGSDVEEFIKNQHFPLYMILQRFLAEIRYIVGDSRVFEAAVTTTSTTSTTSTTTTSTTTTSTTTTSTTTSTTTTSTT